MALRRSGRKTPGQEDDPAPEPTPSAAAPTANVKIEDNAPGRLRSIHPSQGDSQPAKPPKTRFTPNLKAAKQLPTNTPSLPDITAAASVPHPSVTASTAPTPPAKPAPLMKPKPEPRPLAQNSSFPPPARPKTKKAEIIPAKHAGVDALNPNHPLTLPFVDPNSFADHPPKDSEGQPKVHTEIADSLFRNSAGIVEGEGNLFFVQLPNKFPIKAGTPAGSGDAMDNDEIQPSPEKGEGLARIPEALIGKIVIMSSGKVKFKVGDVYYDVSQGFPVSFLQEVVVLNPSRGIYYPLGEVQKRLVVTPDVNALLKAEEGDSEEKPAS